MAIDLFQADELVSRANVNQRLTDIKDMFPVSIANGGTGGTTATLARTNLDVMTGVQLYYNASGYHGSIPLSDTIANYSKIEIFFLFNEPNVRDSNALWTNGASSMIASLTVGYSLKESSEPRIRFFNSVVTLSANTLTFGNESYCTLRPKNTTSSSGTVTVGDNSSYGTLVIYKIVGYKY